MIQAPRTAVRICAFLLPLKVIVIGLVAEVGEDVFSVRGRENKHPKFHGWSTKTGISMFFFPGVATLQVDHACLLPTKGSWNILPPALPEQIANKNMDCVVRFVFATVGQLGVFHRTLHNVSIIGIICELKWKNILSGITHYPVM